MDSRELQLYLEENRTALIDLNKGFIEFKDLLKTHVEQYKAPPTELKVNTEKSVEITNLESVIDKFDTLAEKFETAIKENSYKPIDSVTVKNIDQAKQSTVKIENLDDLADYFQNLADKIESNQPILKVIKQDVVFPKTAKEAIPVRLSDGKSFYKAMFQAVSAANVDTDPMVGYQITERDDTGSTKYFGYVNAKGAWIIQRESSTGSYRWAIGDRTDSVGSIFPDAWTNRANLNYQYWYEVW